MSQLSEGKCPECGEDQFTMIPPENGEFSPSLQCDKCGWTWTPPTIDEVVDKIIEISEDVDQAHTGFPTFIICQKCDSNRTELGILLYECLACGHTWPNDSIPEVRFPGIDDGGVVIQGPNEKRPPEFIPTWEEIFGGPKMYDGSGAPGYGFSEEEWSDFTGDVEVAYRMSKKSSTNDHQEW